MPYQCSWGRRCSHLYAAAVAAYDVCDGAVAAVASGHVYGFGSRAARVDVV